MLLLETKVVKCKKNQFQKEGYSIIQNFPILIHGFYRFLIP